MFGTLRNLASRAKAAFNNVRAIASVLAAITVKYKGPALTVRTRRQQIALRLADATCRNTHRHGYIPPSFEFAHVEGKRDRSQRERSNRRKASR